MKTGGKKMVLVNVKNVDDLGKKADILLKSSIIADKDFSFVNDGNGNYTITIGKQDTSSGNIMGEYVEFCVL